MSLTNLTLSKFKLIRLLTSDAISDGVDAHLCKLHHCFVSPCRLKKGTTQKRVTIKVFRPHFRSSYNVVSLPIIISWTKEGFYDLRAQSVGLNEGPYV